MKSRILIVEDEMIVANDMKHHLEDLGYKVTDLVQTATEAVNAVKEQHPDVVLMDIHIKGKTDGVQAAEEIRTFSDVPIIYLTAFSGTATVERARLTNPHGYILKPFQAGTVHTTIEMALNKHRLEQRIRESERRFRAIADYTYDWEDWVDNEGKLVWVNPAVERLTGFTIEECHRLADYPTFLFLPTNGHDPSQLFNPKTRIDEVSDMTLHIRRKDGSLCWVSVSWQRIYDEHKKPMGFRTSYHDIDERRKMENEMADLVEHLRLALDNVKTLKGLLPICARCKKIRDDKGYWHQVEDYVRTHTQAEFTHGLCPKCVRELYPDLYDDYVKVSDCKEQDDTECSCDHHHDPDGGGDGRSH